MTEATDPPEDHPEPEQPATAEERFPELAELEDEIRRRIRSNQRFLERFMDEDFADEDSTEEDEEPPADREEL